VTDGLRWIGHHNSVAVAISQNGAQIAVQVDVLFARLTRKLKATMGW
jgi:hypothetical protein